MGANNKHLAYIPGKMTCIHYNICVAIAFCELFVIPPLNPIAWLIVTSIFVWNFTRDYRKNFVIARNNQICYNMNCIITYVQLILFGRLCKILLHIVRSIAKYPLLRSQYRQILASFLLQE